MDRESKEKRLRRIRRLREELASSGFPPASSIEHIAALTATLTAMLANPTDSQRASRAAMFSYDVWEKTLKRSATDQLACRRGCSHCCKQYVTASAPQIFAIARHIQDARGGKPSIDAMRQAESLTHRMDRQARFGRGLACALLADDACTVYTLRPLACRAFVSQSLEACLTSFAQGLHTIPAPRYFANARQACELALWAALHERGLPIDSYELNEAVLRAVDEPDAEQRWLAGEDIFADVAQDQTSDYIPAEQKRAYLRRLVEISKGADVELPDLRGN